MIKTHFIIVVTKTEPVNVSSNPGRTHRVVSLAIMLSSSISREQKKQVWTTYTTHLPGKVLALTVIF